MSTPTHSGDVSSEGDLHSHIINTGHIEQRTNLTINVIVERLDQLAELLQQPHSRLCLTAEGQPAVAAGKQELPLPDNLREAFQLLSRAADVDQGLQRRAYAAWLVTRQPRTPSQEVAARRHYIPLAGRLDLQDMPLTLQFTERRWVGQGPQRQVERIKLADVTEAIKEHPALVLLGAPGCGKTTVLSRLALDTGRAFLAGQDVRLPLRINLANFNWPEQTPLEFVSRRWATERLPGHFVDLTRTGQVLLLADGYNEMERLDSEGRQAKRANAWREFIALYFADPANHSRLVLASRDQADYDQPLDLPRVEIEPLDEDQIAAFLRAYLDKEAEAALLTLRRLELLPHAHNPYQLSVLAALYAQVGEALPSNRGALFAEYAYWLVEREKAVGHPHWIRTEAQLAALAHLGYQMQVKSESTVLAIDRLQALLPASVRLGRKKIPIDPEDQFDLACRAGILIPDPSVATAEMHKFSHQLLQEQFAAQHLLARWRAGDDLSRRWRTTLTQADMPATDGGEWDPLPPPPPTGWEQTTILAAGITDRLDAFVQAVLAINPALAGRCLSEGRPPVDAETRRTVQQRLLAVLSDSTLHRRARVQAGRVLAAVGDPRLTPAMLNGGEVILPDLVQVDGGTATLGSEAEEAYDDEQPVHQVEVAPFWLGKYPVTNAEYGCFIDAGGYDAEQYWTPAGWQWRQGQAESSGAVENVMEIYQALVQNPGLIDQLLAEGGAKPDWAENWRGLMKRPAEEVRQMAVAQFAERATDRPFYWDDPAYNQPNQPVVGVTWYEAMAYCAWLNERMGEWANGGAANGGSTERQALWELIKSSIVNRQSQIRLPTEAEWEWAAGGPGHRRYPWGDTFDDDKANTLEGRILGTSPVGVYPAGAAACGALELSGNVYEWTHSLYEAYPYAPEDGREDELAEGRRVLRGGSWDDDERNARVSFRLINHPDGFDFTVGFRVVLAPALK